MKLFTQKEAEEMYALLDEIIHNAVPIEEFFNPAEYLVTAEILQRIAVWLNGDEDTE